MLLRNFTLILDFGVRHLKCHTEKKIIIVFAVAFKMLSKLPATVKLARAC